MNSRFNFFFWFSLGTMAVCTRYIFMERISNLIQINMWPPNRVILWTSQILFIFTLLLMCYLLTKIEPANKVQGYLLPFLVGSCGFVAVNGLLVIMPILF